MRKWIEKILPGYSVLPLILAVSINMLVSFCSAVHSVLCTGIYSVDRELSAGCPGRKRVLLPDRLRRCGSKSDLSVVLFIFSNDTGKTGGDRKRILQ